MKPHMTSLEAIAQEADCTPEQALRVATALMRALHKFAYCDPGGAWEMLFLYSRYVMDSEGCFHLGGIIMRAMEQNGEPGEWGEGLMRLDGEMTTQYVLALKEWAKLRHALD